MTTSVPQCDFEAAASFLDCLDGRDAIYLFAANKPGVGGRFREHWGRITDVRIQTFIQNSQHDGFNIYVQVNGHTDGPPGDDDLYPCTVRGQGVVELPPHEALSRPGVHRDEFIRRIRVIKLDIDNPQGVAAFQAVFPALPRADPDRSPIPHFLKQPPRHGQWDWPFRPTVVVETSPGKLQALWRVCMEDGYPGWPATPDLVVQVKAIEKRLADLFQGDVKTVNPGRVFRLPGTYNVKYATPPLSRILETNPQVVTHQDVVRLAHRTMNPPPHVPMPPTGILAYYRVGDAISHNEPNITAPGLLLADGSLNPDYDWSPEHRAFRAQQWPTVLAELPPLEVNVGRTDTSMYAAANLALDWGWYPTEVSQALEPWLDAATVRPAMDHAPDEASTPEGRLRRLSGKVKSAVNSRERPIGDVLLSAFMQHEWANTLDAVFTTAPNAPSPLCSWCGRAHVGGPENCPEGDTADDEDGPSPESTAAYNPLVDDEEASAWDMPESTDATPAPTTPAPVATAVEDAPLNVLATAVDIAQHFFDTHRDMFIHDNVVWLMDPVLRRLTPRKDVITELKHTYNGRMLLNPRSHHHTHMVFLWDNHGTLRSANKLVMALLEKRPKPRGVIDGGVVIPQGPGEPDLHMWVDWPSGEMHAEEASTTRLFGVDAVTLPAQLADPADGMPRFRSVLYNLFATVRGPRKVITPEGLETIRFFQEWLGAALLGQSTKLQTAVVVHGKPRTGKSVLLDVVASLFGDAGCMVLNSPTQLQDRATYASVTGKNLLAISDDTDVAGFRALKPIISGDLNTGRGNYKDSSSFRARCGVMLLSNSKFFVTDNPGDGLWRRLAPLAVTAESIAVGEIDLGITKQILDHELGAICAWALLGAERLAARKWRLLSTPAIDRDREEWMMGSTSFLDWLNRQTQFKRLPLSATDAKAFRCPTLYEVYTSYRTALDVVKAVPLRHCLTDLKASNHALQEDPFSVLETALLDFTSDTGVYQRVVETFTATVKERVGTFQHDNHDLPHLPNWPTDAAKAVWAGWYARCVQDTRANNLRPLEELFPGMPMFRALQWARFLRIPIRQVAVNPNDLTLQWVYPAVTADTPARASTPTPAREPAPTPTPAREPAPTPTPGTAPRQRWYLTTDGVFTQAP